MIKINFIENKEFDLHKDIVIDLVFANISLVGDSYSFAGNLEDNSYMDIINRILNTYSKSFKIIKNLSCGRTYFWFFSFFDESEEGISITNIGDNFLKIILITKCKYIAGDEYIFEEESYIVNKELFIKSLEYELEKKR